MVLFDDAARTVFHEVGSGGAWDRVKVELDYFDASINRIAAYVIGDRVQTLRGRTVSVPSSTLRISSPHRLASKPVVQSLAPKLNLNFYRINIAPLSSLCAVELPFMTNPLSLTRRICMTTSKAADDKS